MLVSDVRRGVQRLKLSSTLAFGRRRRRGESPPAAKVEEKCSATSSEEGINVPFSDVM